jgi:hypothetical protein
MPPTFCADVSSNAAVLGRVDVQSDEFETELARRPERNIPAVRRIRPGMLQQHTDAPKRWNCFFEQSQPLRAQFLGQRVDPCDVATGPGQRLGQTSGERIVVHTPDHRHALGCPRGRNNGRMARGHDDADTPAHKLRREPRQPSAFIVGIALLEEIVSSLDQPKLAQAIAECVQLTGSMLPTLDLQPSDPGWSIGGSTAGHHALNRRLRRGGGKRQRGRDTAEQRYDLAPVHSITNWSVSLTEYHKGHSNVLRLTLS